MPHKLIITFTLLLSALVAANVGWQNPALGFMAGSAYLVWCGMLAGSWIAPGSPKRWQLFFGILSHLALLTVAGVVVYWFFRLNAPAIGILLGLTPFAWLALPRPSASTLQYKIWLKNQFYGRPRTLGITTLLVLAFLALEIFNLRQLQHAATVEAIRTPWQVVPAAFFVGYLAATLALIALCLRTDHAGRRVPLVLLHVALSLSVAWIVYPLGYGYDQIIHQATEQTIAQAGQILPKPPYYLGQYALMVMLARLFAVDVVSLDRLSAMIGMMAVALGLYFPWRKSQPILAILPLTILILPWSSFAATTPQALANVWLLLAGLAITVGMSNNSANARGHWLVFAGLASLAALVTHPIAGIPAVAIVVAALVMKNLSTNRVKKFFRGAALLAITAASAAAIPLLMIFNSRRHGIASAEMFQSTTWAERFWALVSGLLPTIPSSSNPLLDFAYLVEYWRPWLIAALAIIGFVILVRRKKLSYGLPILCVSAATAASSVIMSATVTFPQLPDYEQLVFPNRVAEIAQLILLPLLVTGSVALLERWKYDAILRLCLIGIGAAAMTANLYLAYPRVDRYHVDHGYNMSAADIAAVRAVAADAEEPYLVLANQMTSAAAVREFGFTPSYSAADGSSHSIYAYPIPTGEPLYQKYLAMVYQQPTKDVAEQAARLVAADVKTVYFVLNKYWDNFDAIAAAAKQNADRWWSVADDRVFVFRYDINK